MSGLSSSPCGQDEVGGDDEAPARPSSARRAVETEHIPARTELRHGERERCDTTRVTSVTHPPPAYPAEEPVGRPQKSAGVQAGRAKPAPARIGPRRSVSRDDHDRHWTPRPRPEVAGDSESHPLAGRRGLGVWSGYQCPLSQRTAARLASASTQKTLAANRMPLEYGKDAERGPFAASRPSVEGLRPRGREPANLGARRRSSAGRALHS